MKKSFMLLLPVFALIFLIINNLEDKVSAPDHKGDMGSFMQGVRIVQRSSGDARWELHAKRADIFEADRKIGLSDIRISTHENDMIIEADRASYDLNTRKLSTLGTVTASNPSVSVTAREVALGNEGALLTASGEVVIEGKNFNLSGKGLVLEPGLERMKVLSNVKAVFHN